MVYLGLVQKFFYKHDDKKYLLKVELNFKSELGTEFSLPLAIVPKCSI